MKLFYLLFVFLFFSSCSKEEPFKPKGKVPAQPRYWKSADIATDTIPFEQNDKSIRLK